MKSYALETLIGVLLFASVIAVGTNYCVEREVVIDLDNRWGCFHVDDSSDGGQTISRSFASDESFLLDFEVRDKHSNPYAVLIVRPQENSVLDWSWMEKVEVTCRLDCDRPKSNHLNFHIRTVEDGYTSEDDPTSLKYNGVVLQPNASFSKQSFNLSDFVVPSWWIQKFDVDPESRKPNFGKVCWLEFTTLARELDGLLEVRTVTIKGHWVSMATLSQGLLGVWMASSLFILLYRFLGLRRELEAKRASEKDLLAINNALSIQSKELSEMASQDELTGLSNRHGARSFIVEAMEQFKRHETDFSLIMFDVDRFKQINDTLGHIFGDKVLCDIATIARHRLRNRDLIIRWGGEEFLIICPDSDSNQAAVLAESLRSEFEESDLNYTASFGICCSAGFETFSEILNAADKALYFSKDSGRNCVSDFDELIVPGEVTKPSAVFPALTMVNNPSSGSAISSD